jgi:hypothetical protein
MTMLPQLAIHVPSVLASQSLNEPAERLVEHLEREVDFPGRPAKRIKASSAAADAALDESGERAIVGRLNEQVAAFVNVKNDVMNSTRNMNST